MSIILEAENSDVDIDLASVRHAEESVMVLGDYMDETGRLDGFLSPLEDSQEDSQSESSDSSFLNIDLGDEIEEGEIDTTEFIGPDEERANQELEEVDI